MAPVAAVDAAPATSSTGDQTAPKRPCAELFEEGVAPATLAALRAAADAVAAAPNFWVPRAQIEAGRGACRTAADVAVVELFERHMKGRIPPNWAGVEYWCQVYRPHRGLAFHFDKDEHLLVAEGRVVTPAWSSVLYLTGGSEEGGRREGPTVIIDQVYDQSLACPVPEDPSGATLVFPLAGAYLAFDGALGHGVLDGFAATQRATLLVNWWDHQPQAVHEATDEQLAEFGIPLLLQPGAAGDAPGGAAAAGQREPRDGAATATADGLTAALSGVAISESASGSVGSRQGGGVGVPEVTAPDAAGLDRAVMVDELIRAAGLRLTGPGAVSAVHVRHPGLVLMPLDPEQIMGQERAAAAAAGQGGGGGGKGVPPPMQTAAALVPPSMLPSESEEEEEDESEEGEDE